MPAAPPPEPTPEPAPPASRGRAPGRWAMLLALLSAFALSQAFRTVTAMLGPGLQAEFGLSARALGAFAAVFGLAFGVTQLFMGVCVDLYGLRRTVLAAFVLAIAGAALSAAAPGYGWLMAGQVLIGVGCSPAFLACTMFIAHHFPAERFAFVSGVGMGVGGLGLLLTGTPLAWLAQHHGWRAGFAALAGLAALSWLLIRALVHEPVHEPTHGPVHGQPLPAAPQQPGWGSALAGLGGLLRVPHTWGIVLLGLTCYAAFLSLRGLWLGPLLLGRFGFSLLQGGNVALALSLIAIFTPVAFGRLDPGPARRRRWIGAASLVMAGCFALLALLRHPGWAVALIVAMGLLSGYSVLQYADVRSSYPAALTGRALSLYTMSMFLGVALMQWATGIAAAWAEARGLEPYRAVMLFIAGWLALASLGFRLLPASPLLRGR